VPLVLGDDDELNDGGDDDDDDDEKVDPGLELLGRDDPLLLSPPSPPMPLNLITALLWVDEYPVAGDPVLEDNDTPRPWQ
jgi:hypothetical protein